jgi:hypothetical protein
MDWSPHDSGEVMFAYPESNGGVKQAMMDAPNHGSTQDACLLHLWLLLANA